MTLVPDKVPNEVTIDFTVRAAGVKFPAATVTGCNEIAFVGYTFSPSPRKEPVLPADT